jgi:hypothetical protein
MVSRVYPQRLSEIKKTELIWSINLLTGIVFQDLVVAGNNRNPASESEAIYANLKPNPVQDSEVGLVILCSSLWAPCEFHIPLEELQIHLFEIV